MRDPADPRAPRTLENPERGWAPVEQRVERVDRAEVEARIGPIEGALERLSGGLANTNLRLPDGRVLRIYRRDAGALPTELALLRRGWERFRVPEVLGVGADFLVLEYVAHAPLVGSEAWGARVGAALAEVHRTAFAQPGLLSVAEGRLQVSEPWPDLVAAFAAHAHERLAGDAAPTLGGLREEVLAFLQREERAMRAAASDAVLLHGDFKLSNLHRVAREERLLVLDWEFAYAGPRVLDAGQLTRWPLPDPFVRGFEEGYRAAGGLLPAGWRRLAAAFDLVNLVGLAAKVDPGAVRARDVRARIEETLRRE